MSAQLSRMIGVPALAMFILSAAACGSEGEETVPADLAATTAATSATAQSHTPQDPSCVAACETIVACLGGQREGVWQLR